MAKGVANAQMLKNHGANSTTGWLQQCGHLPRKDGDGTRANRAGTIMEFIRGQA
jgi:hypothetical protein